MLNFSICLQTGFQIAHRPTYRSDNNIETYLKAKTKQAKTDIVNNVLESIRNSSPNGGFIRKVRTC